MVDSTNDPLNVALREGRFFAKGLSGKYQHTLLTRIGFALLGLFLVCNGLFLYALTAFSGRVPGKEFGAYFFAEFFGTATLIMGVIILFKAFKKEPNHTTTKK